MSKTLISVLLAIVLVTPGLSYALPITCSCVLYLREVMGVNVHGDAWLIQPNVDIIYARVGDVLLLDYNVGHAALITRVSEPTPDNILFTIQEANYHYCQADSRLISINDTHIRGIFRPLSPVPLAE